MKENKRLELKAHLTSGNLTHYALDTFMAPKLSELTACGAAILPDYPDYGAAFRLNRIFVMGGVNPNVATLLENFISRLEFAASEYRFGREKLIEYIDSHPNRKLAPYYQSVFRFEDCVFHLYAVVCVINRLGAILGGVPLFVRKDGSKYDRLRLLFNRVKHFDEDFDRTASVAAQAPLKPLWITNIGLGRPADRPR
jgi:hypothetical protein